MRKMLVIALASGAFGGTLGALVTAAVQSQASPQAIAAAVQRVQDTKAEQTLASVNQKLGQLLASSTAAASDVHNLSSKLAGTGTIFDLPYILKWDLRQICRNTAPDFTTICN